MSSSAIAFPSTDSASHLPPAPIPRPPHLPFRRISLPSAPNIALNRHSVVSLASFDSLLEEGSHTSSNLSPALAPAVILRNAQKHKSQPPPVDHARRNRRRTGVHVDETRLAKRRRVIHEFYDTERTYADGLDLIYSHFLTPIIESLDTTHPLLSRVELTAVFSNFIDIWNFHRSFLTSLTAFISPSLTTLSSPLPSSPAILLEIPPLSPLLLAHFPYLSLYTPFITSFSTTISTLTTLSTVTSPPTAFATFLAKQELHPRCANFHLRDWLLTIVQRCPRYLLLLKDLINCTDPDDPEYRRLEEVHRLVSKITTSLNTSLSTHSQTLQLLAIQRSATNLPFPLVAPGRTFVKRGALLQIESKPASWWSDVRGSVTSLQREFLLFSDYLIWLEGGERESMWDEEDGRVGRNKSKDSGLKDPDEQQNGNRGSSSIPNNNILVQKQTRPLMERSRSKSEAELGMLKAQVAAREKVSGPNPEPVGANLSPPIRSTPSAPHVANGPVIVVPSPRKKKSQAPRQAQSNSNTGDKWVCKGNLNLVDVEIVVGSSSGREWGEERRFEILSPEGSFAVYAESTSARDAWTDAIRDTKASLLISLNAIHPNSTLTSSASTTHLRRSLQALPHSPRAVDESSRGGYFSPHLLRSDLTHGKRTVRQHVEHYVPPVWIPDAKISSCMRCGQAFGWRRRRHHCRLCGRCVCAGCSEKTFFIADPSSPTSSNSGKPARACDECYETVFPPLSEPVTSSEVVSESEASSPFPRFTSPPTPSPAAVSPTLASFPTWLSIPSRSNFAPEPEALMAIEEYSTSGKNISGGSPSKQELYMLRGSPSRRDIHTSTSPKRETYYGNRASPRRPLHRIEDSADDAELENDSFLHNETHEREASDGEIIRSYSNDQAPSVPPVRIRVKPPSRPRSYYDILEDFHGRERSIAQSLSREQSIGQEQSLTSSVLPSPSVSHLTDSMAEVKQDAMPGSAPLPLNGMHELPIAEPASGSSTPGGKGNAPRRNEDTARRHKRFSLPAVALQTTPVTARANATGKGLAKRFSLVLGSGATESGGQEHIPSQGQKEVKQGKVVERGVAATALYELLRGRRKGKVVAG